MYKVGDFVVYRRDVCKVVGLSKKYRNDEDYYKLAPTSDLTLTINTSVMDSNKLFRPVMSNADAQKLIAGIKDINTIVSDENLLEPIYKDLVSSGNQEDLMKVIKTTYFRRENRPANGKKCSEKNKVYFRMAEKMLYRELAVALNKTYDETKEYIVGKI